MSGSKEPSMSPAGYLPLIQSEGISEGTTGGILEILSPCKRLEGKISLARTSVGLANPPQSGKVGRLLEIFMPCRA